MPSADDMGIPSGKGADTSIRRSVQSNSSGSTVGVGSRPGIAGNKGLIISGPAHSDKSEVVVKVVLSFSTRSVMIFKIIQKDVLRSHPIIPINSEQMIVSQA